MQKGPEVSSSLISLNHCGYSPLHPEAQRAADEMLRAQARIGSPVVDLNKDALKQFHEAGAALLKTDPANISFIPNSATGLNCISCDLI